MNSTANPVLVVARKTWDESDPFGTAMAWVVAFNDHHYYDETPDMDNQIEEETRTLVNLRTSGTATAQDIEDAETIMDRIMDVCRANGLAY